MPRHPSPIVALVAALGALVTACGEDAQSTATGSCFAGAVSCDGRWVVTCDPGTLTFQHTKECALGTTCLDGECALTGFSDVVGGDTVAPDTVSPDTLTPDTVVADTLAPDTTPADTFTPDTTPADTTVADTADTSVAEDTAVADTADTAAPEDTTVADTADTAVPEDTTVADTADTAVPEDTTVADTADTAAPEDTSPADTVVADPFSQGLLSYQRITNVAAIGDLSRVRWAADGTHALIVGTSGKLLRYDVDTRQVTFLQALGLTVTDLAVGPGGDGFFVVGSDGGGGKLWHVRAAPFEVVDTIPLSLGAPMAIDRERGKASPRYVIGARNTGTDYIGYFYIWSEAAGLAPVKAFNTSAGLLGVMWGDPAIMGGADFVMSGEGVNGGGSHSWVVGAADVVTNGWSGGYGNGGRASWRPGPGGYGVVIGWSSNHILVFDGTWHNSHWPGPNGNTPQDIAWRADGRRALIVGRVNGPVPIHATVIEIPAGSFSGWTETYVDQSIPSFADAPWYGNSSSMYLSAADWRPVPCDEGLIVGTDNVSGTSSSYGYVIRFYDSTDPACVE